MLYTFNDDKVVAEKKAQLQVDLQDHLQENTNLSDSAIARAKKIARNGRDSVVLDNGSVVDEAYTI